jgi:VWFA-related protein
MIPFPNARHSSTCRIVICCLLLACLFKSTIAQQPSSSPAPKQDEVVRVYTELVQTDVMVFDKQGKFINDLKKEDFELKIDGRVRPIQSFDQIAAGSDEETQLAAARSATTTKRPVPLDRGRVVFFYVDDFHIDLQGLQAARKTIRTFIDKEMGQNDQAAVTSATGQIQFLQQLTDNRDVLNAALERLGYRSYSVRDSERPTMTEYQAILVDREDPIAWDYFIVETMRAMGLPDNATNRQLAAGIVRGRAHNLLEQAAAFSNNTLTGLERLVRGARDVPGRKVVFFLSNGFMIENNRSNIRARLRDVVNSAARSGVVIYSLDTRGLIATLSDVSSGDTIDRTGRMENAGHGELTASQDGLNALAVDTGGRALFNTNDLSKGLKPALKETSVYYLLAWRPENLEGKAGRFRKIEVTVIGKPNLVVRVRRGFYDLPPAVKEQITKKASTDAAKPPAQKLKDSILAAYPKTDLPVTLGINYYDVEAKGSIVSASIQVPGEFLEFGQQNDKIQAIVDLTGVYFNDRGQPKWSFSERLVTTAPSLEASKDFRRDITYTYPAKLTPGLYQVRVAARDDRSGRLGSAQGWIKVPDLTDKRLALSSLLLGEYLENPVSNVPSVDPNQPNISASHRFNRRSKLRLLAFTYNSTPSPTDQKPDLAVQVQVVRDDQPVFTTSLRKVSTDGVPDLTRVPYAADVLLDDLLPGRYVLQVSVIDRISKQSAIQRTHFEVY